MFVNSKYLFFIINFSLLKNTNIYIYIHTHKHTHLCIPWTFIVHPASVSFREASRSENISAEIKDCVLKTESVLPIINWPILLEFTWIFLWNFARKWNKKNTYFILFHAIRLMILSIIFLLFLILLHNFLQKYISFRYCFLILLSVPFHIINYKFFSEIHL